MRKEAQKKNRIKTRTGLRNFTRQLSLQYYAAQRQRYILETLLRTLTIGIIFVSALSIYVGGYLFFADLFVHFQLQYLIALTVLMLVAFIVRSYPTIITSASYILIVTLLLIQPVQFRPRQIIYPEIFFINVNYFVSQHRDIIKEIRSIQPDKVALVEVTNTVIQSLKESYGAPVVYHQAGAFSCAVFSQEKPIEVKIINDGYSFPICYVEFLQYTLIVAHPFPPITNSAFKRQEYYFREIGGLISEIDEKDGKFILVGDFNSTYYSGIFRKPFGRFFQKNMYTWNIGSPLALPIDHVISNMELDISKSELFESDHTGIYVGLK